MTTAMNGQRAWVFGGTSGIGLAAAKLLAESGAQVAVAGSGTESVTAAREVLPSAVQAHVAPAGDEVALTAAFTSFGPFDHLVVCVGGGAAIGPYRNLTEGQLRDGFDNKYWHYQRITRAGLPSIRGAGSITWVTGAAGRRAVRGMSGLAATNGALHAMVGPLALELAPIRVNAVSPGFIDTPYWRKAMPEAARVKLYADMAAAVPVQRVGTPQDVASVIALVAGNGFLTGAILDCDGGRRIS